MYDIVESILQHAFVEGVSSPLVLEICGVLIVVLTVVFIDLIYRIFRHFWR